MKRLLKKYGKTKKQIATEIYDFISETTYNIEGFKASENENLNPSFYAYYADYDWVVFCWLFGRTIDLPKGFPMYCRDLKQMLDECYMNQACKYPSTTRLESWLKDCKLLPDYPKQTNEHNAIADAKWNKKLHDFIDKL